MSTSTRAEALVWPLIYGGLIAVAWGAAVWRQDGDAGPWMVAAGLVSAAAGAVLLVRRASHAAACAAAAATTSETPRR